MKHCTSEIQQQKQNFFCRTLEPKAQLQEYFKGCSYMWYIYLQLVNIAFWHMHLMNFLVQNETVTTLQQPQSNIVCYLKTGAAVIANWTRHQSKLFSRRSQDLFICFVLKLKEDVNTFWRMAEGSQLYNILTGNLDNLPPLPKTTVKLYICSNPGGIYLLTYLLELLWLYKIVIRVNSFIFLLIFIYHSRVWWLLFYFSPQVKWSLLSSNLHLYADLLKSKEPSSSKNLIHETDSNRQHS